MCKGLLLSLLFCVSSWAQAPINGMANLRDLETQPGYDANRLQKARELVRDIERELRFRHKKQLITTDFMVQTQVDVRLTFARIALRGQNLGAEELEILQVVHDIVMDTYYELDVLRYLVQYHQRTGDRDAQLNALEDLVLHPEFGRHPNCEKKAKQFEALASKASLLEQDQMDWALSTWEQYFQAYIDAACFGQLSNTQANWRHYQQLLKKADQKVPSHLQAYFDNPSQTEDTVTDPSSLKQYQQETLAILKDYLGLE